MVLRDIYQPNTARMPPSSSPPSVYFKGAPTFRPAASQPELPHRSSDAAEPQRDEKPQRSQLKRERIAEGEPYALRQWLLRDEAVARCSIEQARSLRQEDADVFYLDTFPCRRVEIVGLVVGIDVRENRTTFLVDDGSSKTLDTVFDHNVFQSFQAAQRVAEHRAQQPPSPPPTYGSAFRKRPAPVDLPPYEHVPRVAVGDTVRIRPKVKKWGANLQFFLESDPLPVTFNDESKHIKLVETLTSQVYPAFDQAAYLASSLAPRKLAPLAPSSRGLPHMPSKRASKIPSSSSPANQSGKGFSSELDFSDLPSSSQASSTSAATPTKFRPSQFGRSSKSTDPNKISSASCDISGLKLRLKEYMFDTTHDVWGMRGLADRSDTPPVVRWLPELNGSEGQGSSQWKGKGRASGEDDEELEANFSSSFDVSVGRSFASAQMDTSVLFAGILNTPLLSSAHPSSSAPPAPPFTISHFRHVPSLRIYGEKVLKRMTREKEEERRAALKAGHRSAKADAAKLRKKVSRDERWFYDEDGIGHEAVDLVDEASHRVKVMKEREPSLTKKLRNVDWVAGKVRNLLKQCLVELDREGEVVRVPPEPWTSASQPPPTASSWSPSRRLTPAVGSIKRDDCYLFICAPTLAPLLLHLLAVENARLPKRSGSTVLDNGKPAPFGASSETLHRRLQAADEDRWHFVTLRKVEDVLQECDVRWDLVERQRGGWREVGN